jgi:MFS family permease
MKFTPRWHFQFPLILLALGAAVAGSLGVGYARAVPIVAAAMLAMGLARGFFAYSTIFYTLAAPGDRVESVGKNEALLSSGIIAGPLVGGLFAHITQNLPIAFALGALVVAVGSLHQVLIRQYIRSLERPPARG